MTAEPWRATPDGVIVACRLTPKGGRDSVDGVRRLSDGTGVLAARVREPPEDGRANDALCALLAKTLKTPASRVRLTAGAKSRLKQVTVSGDSKAIIALLRAL
jgi:uncharacterized protein (TIGR00251 family)